MSVTTSTFSHVVGDESTSLKFQVKFYPPSTITDNNVFMRLVNAEISPKDTTTRVPLLVSVKNLPQPCSTFTESGGECTRTEILGLMAINSQTTLGPRILTHVPDGLQELEFEIKQFDHTTAYLKPGMLLMLQLQFEVCGEK